MTEIPETRTILPLARAPNLSQALGFPLQDSRGFLLAALWPPVAEFPG
jgi:hypothetical protein